MGCRCDEMTESEMERRAVSLDYPNELAAGLLDSVQGRRPRHCLFCLVGLRVMKLMIEVQADDDDLAGEIPLELHEDLVSMFRKAIDTVVTAERSHLEDALDAIDDWATGGIPNGTRAQDAVRAAVASLRQLTRSKRSVKKET